MRYALLKQTFEKAGERYLKANPVGGFFKSHKNQPAARNLIAIEEYTPDTIDWADHLLLNKLQGEDQKCCELIIKFESIFATMRNPKSLVKECYLALLTYSAEAELVGSDFNAPQQVFAVTAREKVVNLSVDKKINQDKHLLELKTLRREYFERLLNPSLPLAPQDAVSAAQEAPKNDETAIEAVNSVASSVSASNDNKPVLEPRPSVDRVASTSETRPVVRM